MASSNSTLRRRFRLQHPEFRQVPARLLGFRGETSVQKVYNCPSAKQWLDVPLPDLSVSFFIIDVIHLEKRGRKSPRKPRGKHRRHKSA